MDKAMLTGIERENWTSTQVGDVFAGLEPACSVSPDVAIEDLLRRIEATGQRKFLVVDQRKLLGVISLSDVVRHLRLSDLMKAT
jgi:CBS domain-containing protein